MLLSVDKAVEERLVNVDLLELFHVLPGLPFSVDLGFKFTGSLIVEKTIEVQLNQVSGVVELRSLSHHHVHGMSAAGHESLASLFVVNLPVEHINISADKFGEKFSKNPVDGLDYSLFVSIVHFLDVERFKRNVEILNLEMAVKAEFPTHAIRKSLR